MKTTLVAVLCAGFAFGLAACEKKTATPPTAGNTHAPNSTTDAIKNAAAGAADAVKDGAAQAKDTAVKTAENLFNSAKQEFDALAAKVANSSSPEKPVWERLVDNVKGHFTTAQEKLSAMRQDNADWSKLSDEFSSIMKQISDGVSSLASKVK